MALKITQDIPNAINRFSKLVGGQPYCFLRWKADKTGAKCLYYKFTGSAGKTKHVKRIPLLEIKAAVHTFRQNGSFDRSDYARVCPVSLSSGPCGFTVIGRYLQFRHNAKYKGRSQGFSR
jgi:hypothetical protein